MLQVAMYTDMSYGGVLISNMSVHMGSHALTRSRFQVYFECRCPHTLTYPRTLTCLFMADYKHPCSLSCQCTWGLMLYHTDFEH